MLMRVVQLNEKKLVGLRIVCPGDEYAIEIPKASFTLYERLNEIKHKLNPINMIGTYVVGDYSDEEDGYWVCVEVENYVDIPEGMVILTVPSQRYAVINHNGPNYQIKNTYEILHNWIEENGYERHLHAWHLEIMQEWGNEETSDIEIELYDTIKS